MSTRHVARFDDDARYLGGPSEQCEHRTVGSHRAWCLTCGEWCHPNGLCVRCERATNTKARRPHDRL
jgi:hypothetical protein